MLFCVFIYLSRSFSFVHHYYYIFFFSLYGSFALLGVHVARMKLVEEGVDEGGEE